MQRLLPTCLLSTIMAASASAQGLYQASNAEEEPLPLKWVLGTNLIYDDNVASSENAESSFGFNPSLGLGFTRTTAQTSWDVNGRLGLIYYPDPPKIGSEEIDAISNQSRVGANLSHRFNERLRFSSQNMASREKEPDYSYGIASSHLGGEYVSLTTDNSFGYRWSERFGSFSGLKLWQISYPGADKDKQDNDHFTWELHNQIRYQLNPQSVLTGDYRYAELTANGNASDATDQYLLAGNEYRFSPTLIGFIKGGVQLHDVTGGDSTTNPYLEVSGNGQISKQFNLKTFIRYSAESEGLVRYPVKYSDHRTLRVGVAGEYSISPLLTLMSGLDYIPGSYQGAYRIPGAPVSDLSDQDETLLNSYLSLVVKFNDFLSGVASYNFTDNTSDFNGQDYTRNRISVGLNATF